MNRPTRLLWAQRLRPSATALAGSMAAALLPGHAAPAQTASARPPRVTVGGVTGFASLADPAATERLRALCDVGLHIHAEDWRPLNAASRAQARYAF